MRSFAAPQAGGGRAGVLGQLVARHPFAALVVPVAGLGLALLLSVMAASTGVRVQPRAKSPRPAVTGCRHD